MTRRSKSAEDQLLFPRGYHVDRELPPKRKGLPAGALGKGLPCAAPSVVFLVASLLLVAMPGACSGFLFLVVKALVGRFGSPVPFSSNFSILLLAQIAGQIHVSSHANRTLPFSC